MDYKDLLKKAYDRLPESASLGNRFEVPKVKGHIEGNKTIISNYNQILTTIRRDSEHFLKYVLKVCATTGKLTNDRLILGSKISSALLNQKIGQYVDTYVICRECVRPDTKLVKEKGVMYLSCQACGAKYVVK